MIIQIFPIVIMTVSKNSPKNDFILLFLKWEIFVIYQKIYSNLKNVWLSNQEIVGNKKYE